MGYDWTSRRRLSLGERGVTLTEILFAMLLFAVVAAGMTAATMATIRATAHSRNLAAAAALAHDKVEDLRALDLSGAMPDELAEGEHEDPANPLTPLGDTGGKFFRRWTVQHDEPNPGLATVDVEVVWQGALSGHVSEVSIICLTPTCA